MTVIGILSNNVVSKSRIINSFKDSNAEIVVIHSAANFDRQSFNTIFIDLDSPQAFLVLKAIPSKCIAFGDGSDEDKFKQAKLLGCEKVFRHGEFFKRILPDYSEKHK